MITQIRNSKCTKVVACYLAIMLFLEMVQPMAMYALTGGPSQPEFNSFTPIGTSDMVDLSSGDFNYNIPIMDVGGYPLNLAYNSNVSMDQEASWVGLGWDLNVGQINRQMRGIPDDFNGDKMVYENNMKPNITIGGSANVFVSPYGSLENLRVNAGVGIKYNNYDGFGFSQNAGISYQISENMTVGMGLESSSTDGVTATPSVSFHAKKTDKNNADNTYTGSLGVSMNSRKGVEGVTISGSKSKQQYQNGDVNCDGVQRLKNGDPEDKGGLGGSITLNDAAFTPSKRVGMASSNIMSNFNLEYAIKGIDPGMKFSGYMSTQGIKDSEKYKVEAAYGYENTTNATESDVLDFNREKDRTVNKNTVSLPLTNYTYDLYSVQGQGVGGMYRPYRSQVGYIFDNYTRDDSAGGSLGIEIGVGTDTHFGFDATVTDGESSTGLWTNGNSALPRLKEKKTGNYPNYEKVFFKNIGGMHVDKDSELFKTSLGGYDPITFRLNGSKWSRGLQSKYYDKFLEHSIAPVAGTPYLARNQYRLSRNQVIQNLTMKEARKFGFRTKFSPYAKKGQHDHHTSEVRILKEGGEHYIYGRAAYNVTKKEVTFDVGTLNDGDCSTGLVTYNGSANTGGNQENGDQYFNSVKTPAYAHTYLLSSVLSPDYQDLGDPGPSDDDLGAYTKFSYTSHNKKTPYKWRIPYGYRTANYDEGLRSLNKDNKGNYQYGEKELLYIEKIETKTHVAIFTISARKDGYGVTDENGGANTSDPSKMWKLEKISLYSKPEYIANGEQAVPIKEAHFVYDYDLCQGVPNNLRENAVAPSELANQGGKLTLKKVYFTYRNSNMGKYTPYVFNYDQETNFDYNQRAYDIWGNYKPVSVGVGCGTNDTPSNAEDPYVEQIKENADEYASAWLLSSINLPSGGTMEMSYESDDYKHVQDRDIMQLFDVVGCGENNTSTNPEQSTDLRGKSYIYIKLNEQVGYSADNYVKKLMGKNVFFRFLLNMTDPSNSHADKYDYVTGYLTIASYNKFTAGGAQYLALNVQPSPLATNPITQAGYYYGRQNLNNVVYSLTGNEDVNNLEGVISSIVHLTPDIINIFRSPDAQLKEKSIARRFIKNKSWIRLINPSAAKFGGGSRVREIKIHDKWDVMTNHEDETVYEQYYGQQYSYTTTENFNPVSSGVATYEPLGSKENPLVEPFYDHAHRNVLLASEATNYVEMPFGECFYPAPKVTYSKVTVKNLPRTRQLAQGQTGSAYLSKHATGHVVNEFYTSFDYPTISDLTKIDPEYDPSPLGQLINIYVQTHLSMAQGFSIHTNDMDGKMKAQWVYAEGQTTPISGVEYKYDQNTDEFDQSTNSNLNTGKLDNYVTTVNAKGNIARKLVGVDYDVINDFRQNESTTETPGIHFNTEGLLLVPLFITVPVPLPSYSYHENVLRQAVTTKVIHTCGILRETIAYDLGSKVSTRNLAWDADSGDVILTETVNEYNDKYYNFNFPAYWAYKGMSQAALNLGLQWNIKNIAGTLKFKFDGSHNASDYLSAGDQLYITSSINKAGFKAWVVDISANSFRLIDSQGIRVPADIIPSGTGGVANIKVIKSANANMQTATMASVTSMKNPLYNYAIGQLKVQMDPQPYLSNNWADFRIVNASAIEYNDVWPSQCECGLPKMKYDSNHNLVFEFNVTSNDDSDIIAARSYNPYLFNVLGNWRPVKSYAFLTGRNSTGVTPRKNGFFNSFRSFYKLDGTKWVIDQANFGNWTFASEISGFSSYGQEVENKDALDRYSSAYYGYNNRFPVAVAANTKYNELAYDGFEDYGFSECASKSHFNFKETLTPRTITVTDKEAHTGRRSIRLEPGKMESGVASPNVSTIRKKVLSCTPPPPPAPRIKNPVETATKANVVKPAVGVKKAEIKSSPYKAKLNGLAPKKGKVRPQLMKPAPTKVITSAKKNIKK
jgi:hypothetical protein